MPYGFGKGIAAVVDVLDMAGVFFMLTIGMLSTVCTD